MDNFVYLTKLIPIQITKREGRGTLYKVFCTQAKKDRKLILTELILEMETYPLFNVLSTPSCLAHHVCVTNINIIITQQGEIRLATLCFL